MFRTFTEEDDRRQQQRSTKAGAFSGSNNNSAEKTRIVRDRTTDTQTTVSSLGVYSTDLLTEYSGDYITSDNDFIVSISKDVLHESSEEIEDEVDLDARSESTTMTSNKLHEIQYPTTFSNQTLQKQTPTPSAYTNPNSIYDIPRSSSWVEDKPFDEESILNMSDISDSDKARMLPSFYSNSTIPVKEYILPPPPPPPPLPASPPGSPPPSPPRHGLSKDARHIHEVIEMAPDAETGKTVTQVVWNPEDNRSMAEEDMYLEAVSAAAGAGATLSTASPSKARSFQSQGRKERSRRLKLCVLAGCLVTLLCLMVIIIAVAVSRNNSGDTDLSSSAVQSGGLENNTDTTASPSLRATAAPSAGTTVLTAAPTQAPIKPAPWYDSSATPNPTAAPPTESPTNRPTPNPTASPTARPVEPPTFPPTQPPTARPTYPPVCMDAITTTQDCLNSENVLVMEFQNCEPEDGDWVGLYPDGSEFMEDDTGREFLSRDWISWAWTCGGTECENSPPSNSFSFSIDMDDPVYNLFNLRAFLVRGSRDGPPFEVIAKSEPFAVTEMCGR